MKDRVLNILMLLTVFAALTLTLIRGEKSAAAPALPLAGAVVTAAPTAAPHPVDVYRRERAAQRQQEQETLLSLLTSAGAASETRAQAEAQLLAITRDGEIELAVEAAMAAKGYGHALCVSRQDNLTLFLPQDISAREAALFLDIAAEASGLQPERIKITGETERE